MTTMIKFKNYLLNAEKLVSLAMTFLSPMIPAVLDDSLVRSALKGIYNGLVAGNFKPALLSAVIMVIWHEFLQVLGRAILLKITSSSTVNVETTTTTSQQ